MEIENPSSVLGITDDGSTAHTICHAENKNSSNSLSVLPENRIKQIQEEMLKHLKVLKPHMSYI